MEALWRCDKYPLYTRAELVCAEKASCLRSGEDWGAPLALRLRYALQ
jgi:hypothetical protein